MNLHGAKLIHAAEDGTAAGGDEAFTHAEGVDLRALTQKLRDEALIKGIGDGDGALRPARIVEHAPRALREIGHIPRVEADAAFFDAEGLEDLIKCADRVRNAGFERIICVHE